MNDLELLDETLALARRLDLDRRLAAAGYSTGRRHRVQRPRLLVRSFDVTVTGDDGGQLRGVVVPYDQPTVVSDRGGPVYREMFVRGAFAAAVAAPSQVLLDFEHHEGIGDVVGYATRLVERGDGLHGTFTLLATDAGRQARELNRAGVLTSFSVGAVPLAHQRRPDGVVVRTRCLLDRVALCRRAAYAGTEARAPA